MLRGTKMFIVIVIFIITNLSVFAQQVMEDVVYLKNGSIIHGTIIEQVPGKTLKIKTHDGNIFVYSLDEVEKMTKETSTNPVLNSGEVSKPISSQITIHPLGFRKQDQ
jgi:hypothetical protein